MILHKCDQIAVEEIMTCFFFDGLNSPSRIIYRASAGGIERFIGCQHNNLVKPNIEGSFERLAVRRPGIAVCSQRRTDLFFAGSCKLLIGLINPDSGGGGNSVKINKHTSAFRLSR